MEDLLEVMQEVLQSEHSPSLQWADLKKLELMLKVGIANNELKHSEIARVSWFIKGVKRGYFTGLYL